VALLALFLTAGGIGYAATSLPRNSVGTEQLRNDAVTNPKIRALAVGNHKLAGNAVGFRKIIPGTVGAARVNRNAVQLRVTGTCPPSGQTTGGQTTTTTAGQAITAIQNNGRVTCGQSGAAAFEGGEAVESDGTPSAVSVPDVPTSAKIMGVTLPANSSYVVLANPSIQVNATSGEGHIAVGCDLNVTPQGTAGRSGTQHRGISLDVGGFGATGATPSAVQASRNQSATFPLQVSVPTSTVALNVDVTCSRALSGNLPAATTSVGAFGTIIAIATSSQTTLPSTVTVPTGG